MNYIFALTKKKKMENSISEIQFAKPILYLTLFAFIVGIIVLLLSSYDKKQKKQLVQLYNFETQNYISSNYKALNTLFNQIFPNSECRAADWKTCEEEAVQRRKQMENLKLSADLKDYSSTVFIKKGGDGRLLKMTLSSDISELYIYNDVANRNLNKLFNGEINDISMDDYVIDLSGNEIVVPVLENDKIIGIIARRVIK